MRPLHQGQRIAILGAGTSGVAAARLAMAGGAAWAGVFDSGDPAKLGGAADLLRREGIEVRLGGDARAGSTGDRTRAGCCAPRM